MTVLEVIRDWRPRTPFYYGWLILAMCALGTFVGSGISQGTMGGIQGFIIDDTGWTRNNLALGVSLGTWIGGLMAPLVGYLADRHGPRWLTPIALAVVGISYFSLANVHSLWQFYLAYILGRIVSVPILVGVVPRTTAVNFFRRKRNMALALTGMARHVGGSINIQMISAISVAHSWRTASRYMGIMSLILTLPLMLALRRRPEDIGMLPDGDVPGSESSTVPGTDPQPSSSEVGSEVNWSFREALGTHTFRMIGVASPLATLGVGTVAFLMVPYLHDEVGLSNTQATGVLSLSTALAVTNLGWGYLADRFTPKACLVATLVLTASSLFYLLTVSSLAGAYVFGLIWGLSIAGIEVLGGMMLAQYFGRASYGSIIGTLTPLQIGALGLGPLLGTWVRDLTKSYKIIPVGTAAVLLFAALLFLFVRHPGTPKESP